MALKLFFFFFLFLLFPVPQLQENPTSNLSNCRINRYHHQNCHLLHHRTGLRHSQIIHRAQPLQDQRLHHGDIPLLLLPNRRFPDRSSVRIVKVRVSIVSPAIKNCWLLYFLLSSLFFCWGFFVCF